MKAFEIIVAGGGPAGLAAACLMALEGRRVALISGTRSPVDDPRTVALMQPQIRLLAHLGVWPGTLKDHVAALKRLRMVDDTGAAMAAPTLTFDPGEIGEEVFGWNIPLALLLQALQARCAELQVETVAADVSAARTSADRIEVDTGDGSYSAALAIAADGRRSILREAAGIFCRTWAYDQVAVASSFDHSASHGGISSEYHRPAGPLTTVPMAGQRSSLVWMERPERAAELMALSDRGLAAEIQIATHGELGLISALGARKAFAMEGLMAQSFAARRIMLIGETAHVVPPIGAQGLNMSLRDAAQAAEIIARESDPGVPRLLRDYDRMRRFDVWPRQQMIDLMNRSLLSGLMPVDMARSLGLELLGRFGPLRRYVMRRGLGPVSTLPRVMRAHGSSPALMA